MKRPKWRDLRDWLDLADALGELRTVEGASSEADIGNITEMLDHSEDSPCVLFDSIPGFQKGFRVAVNCQGTRARQAITLGLDPATATHQRLMDYWRGLLRGIEPLDPREVDSGPILENVQRDSDVDLSIFPAPIWHPQDGGRFIGTASLNILRDPDSGWVNASSYRNQVFDEKSIGIWISPGKHGRLIRDKYFANGERCPVVVVVGSDPLLFMAACAEGIRYGVSEMAWAGAVQGRPVEIVRGELTGLPIPARAEIALEGFIEPEELHAEGPYGEWMGYYATGAIQTPIIHIKRVYHRDDPIILGCPQGKPPHEDNRFLAYLRSCLIQDQLERAGVPNVRAVWSPPVAGNRLMTIVSIKQSYPGHAKQAALIASQCSAGAYMGRFVVVVDDDIDVTNMDDMLWAMLTRCDPQRDIEIITRCWSGPLDAAVKPEDRGLNSRAIVDATRPYEWQHRFPDPVVTPEEAAETRRLWSWLLKPDGRPPPDSKGVELGTLR
jgi:4-hydroxy-3-polyprenylbenzoate decarboxylase